MLFYCLNKKNNIEMEFKRFKSENPVWGYFQRSTNDERAKCDTCGTNIFAREDQQEL